VIAARTRTAREGYFTGVLARAGRSRSPAKLAALAVLPVGAAGRSAVQILGPPTSGVRRRPEPAKRRPLRFLGSARFALGSARGRRSRGRP